MTKLLGALRRLVWPPGVGVGIGGTALLAGLVSYLPQLGGGEVAKLLGDLRGRLWPPGFGVGVAATALVAGLLYYFFVKRPAPVAAPPAPGDSLADLWTSFLNALPRPVRSAPVTLVLGERLSGKSALIKACLDPARQQEFFLASSTDDPRLQLYPGGDQLVQEISGELIAVDAPPEPLRQLFQSTVAPRRFPRWLLALTSFWPGAHARLRGLLSTSPPPLIVAVVNTRAKSWTPEELRRLGARMRARIDLVTEAYGATPHLRVCLTHLDETDGFGAFAAVLREAGEHAYLIPASPRPADLGRSLEPLGGHLSTALATLPEIGDVEQLAGFRQTVGFLSKSGPKLLCDLSPFLDTLLGWGPRTGSLRAPPRLDGVFLSGIPENGEPAFVGDPFALDRLAARRHSNLVDSRRDQTARVLGGALAIALIVAYAAHAILVVRAGSAVDAFATAARPDVARTGSAAAAALDATSNPIWPPLHVAFQGAIRSAQRDFLDQLRRVYLLDAARSGARGRRIRAFGLLYATRSNQLGKLITSDPEGWESALSLPSWVAPAYRDQSERPWEDPQHDLRKLDPIAAVPAADPLRRWRAFLDGLNQLFDRNAKLDLSKLEALRAQREELLRTLDDTEDVNALRDVIDALEKDAKIDRALFGADAVSPEVAKWFHDHRKDLRGILDLIAVPVAAPASGAANVGPGRGLVEELRLVEGLFPPSNQGKTPACVWMPPPKTPAGPPDAGAPADAGGADAADADSGTADAGAADVGSAAPPPPTEYAITLPDGPPTYRFERRVWNDLTVKDRAGQYLRDFLADVETGDRCMFFPPTPARAPCKSLDPAFYTSKAFNEWVKPGLEVLDTCLDALNLADADRTRLKERAATSANDYKAAYVTAQDNRWASFQLNAGSSAELRGALGRIVVTPSWFSDFLATAASNANLGALESDYLRSLTSSLAAYRPLVVVMTPAGGPSPELDKYTAILAQMLPALEPAPLLPSAGVPLADRLSPLGRAALDVLTSKPTSSYVAVQKWLDEAGLVGDLRKPFLRPVELAYDLGIREVEGAIAAAWRSEIAPGPTAILGRFPFQRTAVVDTSAAEMAQSFGPNGAFWTAFGAVVAPVMTNVAGPWQAKSGPLGAVGLPAGALELANDLLVLKASLWNEAGAPRPITLQVKPSPMAGVSGNEAVTLAVLQASKSSVFAFNQDPDWQPLEVVWGSGQGASVALRISPVDGGDPRYRTLDGGSSDFAFHHLLTKSSPGKNLPPNTLEWVFPGEKPGDAPRVRFTFQTDPWAPFQRRAAPR